jgi:hypothetical protein
MNADVCLSPEEGVLLNIVFLQNNL